MQNRTLTKDEIKFIVDNYSKMGIDYCADSLKLTRQQIKRAACYRKLKLARHDYIKDLFPITPQSAYTLGFFTGDGCLYLPDRQVSISIVMDDGIKLKDIFMVMPWRISFRHQKDRQEQINFRISSKSLSSWLGQHNFQNKSKVLPNIDFIPNEYMSYFLLGLFDADGCVSLREGKNRGKSFFITASYDYDWSSLIKIFNDIDVNFHIYKSIDKNNPGRRSKLTTYKIKNLQKIYNYFYKTYDQDKIGLPRKHDKFKFILEQFNI